ncbi:hypothetical protein N7524_010955 [Penicillium chrysogenum]|nr:hypothetical protein N7524_010955 [Penicillium chrysogenum]
MRPSLITPFLALTTGTLALYMPDLGIQGPAPIKRDIKAQAPKGVDLEYAKCYRITNSEEKGLGLFNNLYYQWGGREGRRIFKVCRHASNTRGTHCKADSDNQAITDNRPFYLLDASGSATSNGQAWMASSGWMYPLANGWSPTLISELVAERSCDIDDNEEETDCFYA